MRKALVIGAAGNLGKPLSRYLATLGYDVVESDIRPGYRPNYLTADINNPLDLLPAFDHKPDVVFLLAGIVGRVACEQAASLSIGTNLAGINNVIQMCKRTNSMLVYFSTSEVYGPDCDPMDEAQSDPQPNNRYGLEKLLGEKLVEYEVRYHKLRAVSIRPCMIYSEDEDFGDHRSAMIRFAYRLARGEKIEVHRGSLRGWMHVTDLARAVEAAAHVKEYMAINVGHPDIRPIEDLAEMIRARLGAPKQLVIEHDLPPQMTSVKRPVLDRQTHTLGIECKVSLEEGVDRLIARVNERLALMSRAA
ncbi:MAG: NAD(P)-dependent oxidoreductase [Planctomycetaceae bacterium]|nr:NAD(P)-dependent oxidoreductase [Planctomycetaceae bacterium]